MPLFIWLLAGCCAVGLLAHGFLEAYRLLRSRKEMLAVAAAQLASCRRHAALHPDDPASGAVLARCESIYGQAAAQYNRLLRRPWIYLAGTLLGFRRAE